MTLCVVHKLPAHITDKQKRAIFLNDLDTLHLSKNDKIFKEASELFVLKWYEEYPNLIEYFENEWLIKNRFWYEGVAELVPSQNNALESTNRYVKDENTLRELFDLGRFRVVIFEIIQTWSMSYSNGLKEFQQQPKITLEMWTNSYNLAKLNVKKECKRIVSCSVDEKQLEKRIM